MKAHKVCHMSSVHSGLDVRIFHKECCSLVNHSFQVTLVINANNQDISTAESCNVRLIKLDLIKSRMKRILFQNYKCYREALKTNSDIYHFHDPELIPFGVLLKLRGKIVVYDVHEDVPKAILNKHWIPSFARKFVSYMAYAVEFIAAKYFFEVITATPFILGRFKRANPRSININNFPLDRDIPREVVRKECPNEVCYIGGITKHRGLEEIITALDILQEKIELNLAGNFVEKDFEHKIIALDAWKKVNWYGYVGRDKVRDILSKSIAGLVTLHPTATYIDSLPVKLFEYMAFGLPVIASDFPLWREIIIKHKCGILVDPESPAQIADAIKYCINNRARAFEMGENGRKAIFEEYNWRNEEKKLIKLYTELLT